MGFLRRTVSSIIYSLSQEGDTGVFGVALSLALTQELLIVGLTVNQPESREYDQCKREQLHGWLLASYL
jgi:hypothetical protein